MGKKKKSKYIKPTMPVTKPDSSHMPTCSSHDCNRKVSDARKMKCSHCGNNSSSTYTGQYDQFYEMYD